MAQRLDANLYRSHASAPPYALSAWTNGFHRPSDSHWGVSAVCPGAPNLLFPAPVDLHRRGFADRHIGAPRDGLPQHQCPLDWVQLRDDCGSCGCQCKRPDGAGRARIDDADLLAAHFSGRLQSSVSAVPEAPLLGKNRSRYQHHGAPLYRARPSPQACDRHGAINPRLISPKLYSHNGWPLFLDTFACIQGCDVEGHLCAIST